MRDLERGSMRFILLPFFAFLVVSPARAQPTEADIIEYGSFAAAVEPVRIGAHGYNTSPSVRHLQTKHTIPAQPGTVFGFTYKLAGSFGQEPLILRQVVIFPPPGLVKPGTGTIHGTEIDAPAKLGEIGFVGYALQQPWELVPGVWTMELWFGNRELASEAFTVGGERDTVTAGGQ